MEFQDFADRGEFLWKRPAIPMPDLRSCLMLKMAVAVVVHLVLLALACTSFTLISVWIGGAWTLQLLRVPLRGWLGLCLPRRITRCR